jgi:peptidoglycan/LPS O-acetylase OafA/YrhL
MTNLPKPLGLSIDFALNASGGRPSGFDYLRMILACSVIVFHSASVTMGSGANKELFNSAFRPAVLFIMPSFFALSGFLVAGSLLRCRTLGSFLYLRLIRLVPALSVEVFLSALVIGWFFTTLSASQYFTDSKFFAYFLNILGDIHYTLPGVFENNPDPLKVNAQLWTVPIELRCYILLSILAVLGTHHYPRVFLLLVLIFETANILYLIFLQPESDLLLRGRTLIMCFLWGVLFYLYRDKIIMNIWLFMVSTLLFVALVFIKGGEQLIGAVITYMTVYLGTRQFYRNQLLLSGDYSYGMYLYGYPIQQALVAAWPYPMRWYENAGYSIALAGIVAACSWFLIERPALGLRTRAKLIDDFVEKSPVGKIIGLKRRNLQATA